MKRHFCPQPRLVSALDPAAQPALEALNAAMVAFYNSPVVDRYFATAETINADWPPDFKPHHHLRGSIPPESTVLDIGCGSAHPARHLAGVIGRYIGVDWSEQQIARNRDTFPQHTFIAGSVYDVALPASTADVVTCFYVIEHCVWPHRLLDEILRLTRPGGLIAILTPPFRHGAYLKSFPYGLSAQPFPAKLRRFRWLDAALHLYQHRFWYPRYLRRHHPRGAEGQEFLIFQDPVCLTAREWFPDADAVYLADTAEIASYLSQRGAETQQHWPEWGYVLARKAVT